MKQQHRNKMRSTPMNKSEEVNRYLREIKCHSCFATGGSYPDLALQLDKLIETAAQARKLIG